MSIKFVRETFYFRPFFAINKLCSFFSTIRVSYLHSWKINSQKLQFQDFFLTKEITKPLNSGGMGRCQSGLLGKHLQRSGKKLHGNSWCCMLRSSRFINPCKTRTNKKPPHSKTKRLSWYITGKTDFFYSQHCFLKD